MRRYTDEQLSRILSAHEAGKLRRYGGYPDEYGQQSGACVNQAAYLCYGKCEAYARNKRAAEWFDNNYSRKWTADQLLLYIEAVTS